MHTRLQDGSRGKRKEREKKNDRTREKKEERSERFSKCNFSLMAKKMRRMNSAFLDDNEEKKHRAEKELCRGTRVTYMQFILTKGASLSHCAERRDRRRQDRREDLNILLRDSHRDNSDGDESRLGVRRREKEKGKGVYWREREGDREGVYRGRYTDNSPSRVAVSKYSEKYRRVSYTWRKRIASYCHLISTSFVPKERCPERRMQIELPVSWR